MRLILVQRDNLFLAWPEALPYIQSALEFNAEYAVNDILTLLTDNALSLWMFYNDEERKAMGAMITEVLRHPRTTMMSIVLLGADDFEKVVSPLFDEFIEYASSIGINTIESLSRFGMERLLKDKGFKKTYVILRKDLE